MSNKQKGLFDEELFNEIREHDVEFPLFFKNKYNTIYTYYIDIERFEQITINRDNESFRGNILFGYNEMIINLRGDLQTWYYLTFQNQIQIKSDEYEQIFQKIIADREKFLSNENDFKYMRRELLEQQKNVKHKWKSPEY